MTFTGFGLQMNGKISHISLLQIIFSVQKLFFQNDHEEDSKELNVFKINVYKSNKDFS